MPLRRGKDSHGRYYQWGNSSKKYYYYNEAGRKKAKQKAIIQGYAIEKSLEKRGKPSALAKARSTGRKTQLKKTLSSQTTKRSGSKRSSSRKRSARR